MEDIFISQIPYVFFRPDWMTGICFSRSMHQISLESFISFLRFAILFYQLEDKFSRESVRLILNVAFFVMPEKKDMFAIGTWNLRTSKVSEPRYQQWLYQCWCTCTWDFANKASNAPGMYIDIGDLVHWSILFEEDHRLYQAPATLLLYLFPLWHPVN